MDDYVKARGRKVKARTVNRDVLQVGGMFAFAKRRGLPFKSEDFVALKLSEPQPNPNAITLASEQMKRRRTPGRVQRAGQALCLVVAVGL